MENEKFEIDSNLSAHIALATSCNHCFVPQCLLYCGYSYAERCTGACWPGPTYRWKGATIHRSAVVATAHVNTCEHQLAHCASPFIHATSTVRPQHRQPVLSDCQWQPDRLPSCNGGHLGYLIPIIVGRYLQVLVVCKYVNAAAAATGSCTSNYSGRVNNKQQSLLRVVCAAPFFMWNSRQSNVRFAKIMW